MPQTQSQTRDSDPNTPLNIIAHVFPSKTREIIEQEYYQAILGRLDVIQQHSGCAIARLLRSMSASYIYYYVLYMYCIVYHL